MNLRKYWKKYKIKIGDRVIFLEGSRDELLNEKGTIMSVNLGNAEVLLDNKASSFKLIYGGDKDAWDIYPYEEHITVLCKECSKLECPAFYE